MIYAVARMSVRAAWAVMDAGEAAVRFAERLEVRAAGPGTALCALSCRLMTFGERVQDLGTASCAWVKQQAQRLGCNQEDLMSQVLAQGRW
jgi:hypothetical protein